MRLKLKSTNSGFTLIELIVVIVIVGILATAPVYVDLVDDARKAAMRQVWVEMEFIMRSTSDLKLLTDGTRSVLSGDFDPNTFPQNPLALNQIGLANNNGAMPPTRTQVINAANTVGSNMGGQVISCMTWAQLRSIDLLLPALAA